MKLTGELVIGQRRTRGTGGDFHAQAADGGEMPDPVFGGAVTSDVDTACTLAESAFDEYRQLSAERRAAFLEAIGEEIMAIGDALPERAHKESGLPMARLTSERQRTVNQLRLFARLVREGRNEAPVLDSPLPDRQPPRADLRQRRIPLGPVAVFGASNFPLAFSVAGGDTASALAAGCPVIVKAHEAHPGTSEMTAVAIMRAAARTEMPDGVFSMLFAHDMTIGQALVRHPAIQAIGFTGSRQGGIALLRLAQARPQPVPLYAEMSSINPVFLMPAALEARAEKIAEGFAASLTTGTGQLCTNPGLLIAFAGPALERFQNTVASVLPTLPPTLMLTSKICQSWREGIDRLSHNPKVSRVAGRPNDQEQGRAGGVLFRTNAAAFLSDPALEDEVFGPGSLLVVCQDFNEMRLVAEHLSGQLTATLHLEPNDYPMARGLLPVLERKAGRILVNDYPTGVEVCDAMVHGGPWPSTSDSRTTSVGSEAIDRFLRPVCYQNLPEDLLPASLKSTNPLHLWRRRDGTPVQDQ
ncbi:aldehyde dehydrogenase (NADP(+)) [Acetobacter fallax]|uniref:Aldehyde dehydrogenase family protein n=1 Tax=Acetobacter fallax TaxID=1737473 RepID=A0ABX0K7I3_9PROT|nr:aldehyde dehydrogenase (NADP(+)) [Acetobacter fallax]NHO31722.1 aldehyde dehydrogenase family protein [Acetobacter fallax]NHO35281.1 aldehyde dehydrogenase family protein [Acetobacter fallax]